MPKKFTYSGLGNQFAVCLKSLKYFQQDNYVRVKYTKNMNCTALGKLLCFFEPTAFGVGQKLTA